MATSKKACYKGWVTYTRLFFITGSRKTKTHSREKLKPKKQEKLDPPSSKNRTKCHFLNVPPCPIFQNQVILPRYLLKVKNMSVLLPFEKTVDWSERWCKRIIFVLTFQVQLTNEYKNNIFCTIFHDLFDAIALTMPCAMNGHASMKNRDLPLSSDITTLDWLRFQSFSVWTPTCLETSKTTFSDLTKLRSYRKKITRLLR